MRGHVIQFNPLSCVGKLMKQKLPFRRQKALPFVVGSFQWEYVHSHGFVQKICSNIRHQVHHLVIVLYICKASKADLVLNVL